MDIVSENISLMDKTLLMLCTVLLVTGCGSDSSSPANQEKDEDNQHITLRVSASDGGNAQPSSQQVIVNGSVSVEIFPETGFEIAELSGCPGSLQDTRFTSEPLTEDCTLTVSFVRKQYQLTATSSQGGSLTPAEEEVYHGLNAEFQIITEDGFTLETITGCSGQLQNGIYLTEAITSDCDIEAHFTPISLPAPLDVEAQIENNQIVLSWQPVENAEGYHLYYATETGVTVRDYASYNGGTWVQNITSPWSLAGAEVDTDYYFRITAFNEFSESPASETVQIFLPDITPEPPENNPGPGTEPPPVTNNCDYYFSPNGSGGGLTASQPASVADLNGIIEADGPGKTFCLQEGNYSTGLTINHGGNTSDPATIKGLGKGPLFSGDFNAVDYDSSGEEAITVSASHLVFESLRFKHVGRCFNFREDVSNILLKDFRAENVSTCVDVNRYRGHQVENLTIDGAMILQFVRSGILIGSRARNIRIENSYLDMQPQRIGGRGKDYVTGIGLYDEARDVVINNTTVLNVIGKSDGYSQGDGIDAESSVSNITVSNSYFRGHQDGCIDTKAEYFVINNVTAIGCKRNFRLWQNNYPNGPRCQHCISYQPTGDAHIYVTRDQAEADKLEIYATNTAKIVVGSERGNLAVKQLLGAHPESLIDSDILSIESNQATIGGTYSLPRIPNPTIFSD